jgi:hypothetical protein
MFRVIAANPDEACQKIHAKAEIIGTPRIWQAVDGSYECQVEVRTSEHERMDKTTSVHT